MRALAWILALLLPASVAAQAPSDDAMADGGVASARADFERGIAAMEAGRPEAAVAAFEASLAELPYLATAYNLAIAYEAVGRDRDAADLLDRILRGELGALGPTEAREAREVYAAVRARVGLVTLRVEGAPEAWVRVDDAEETRAVGGDEARIALTPGHHVVHVGAPGQRPRRLLVRAQAGVQNALRVRFDDRDIGTLRVRAPEDGERVEIVGVTEGPSPLEHDLPAGVYEVGLVALPGSRRSVSVSPGALADVDLTPGGADGVVIGILVGAAGLALTGAAVAIGVAASQDDGPLEEPVFGIISALTW